MTLLKHFAGLFAVAILLFSCKKEKSLETNQDPIIVDASWEFMESGTIYAGDVDTAVIFKQPGFSILTLEGTSSDTTNGEVVIQVAATEIIPGVYTSPQVNFIYIEDGAAKFEIIPNDPNFSITITEMDSVSISGTFTGVLNDGQGNQRTITNGKFTAPLSTETTNEPLPEPEGDYMPARQKWTFGEMGDYENDTLTITYIGDTTIEGLTYRIHANDRTGEHKYYRKTGSNYYEYTVVNFGIPAAGAPAADVLILNEEAAVDEFWETPAYQVTVSNMPVTAKMRYTIIQRDGSVTLKGRTYQNIIEVRSELYVQENDGTFIAPGTFSSTVFAKGVGIIYYVNMNEPPTEWGLRYFTD